MTKQAVKNVAQSRAAERLLNRELSWLDCNARVLELARGPERCRCSSA